MNSSMRVALCAVLFFITACGTLEVSIERTATPDAAPTGTLSALQTQNAQLATMVAMSTQPAGAPTLLPPQPSESPAQATAELPPATRITFLSGASVGVVSAPIAPGETQTYVVDVFEQQPMYVYVASQDSDVSVSIKTENGITMLNAQEHRNSWQGTLPQTGDYYVTVHGGAATENFSLTVTIPWRIQFSAGADSATVSGKTVAGYDVSYTVFALKGQTMRVDLENRSSKASLAIYGFTDGQSYLKSNAGQDSYHFVLPATQDYIVVVVPMAGSTINYIMTVTIQ